MKKSTELVRYLIDAPFGARLRLAVTKEEYEQVRQEMLAQDGFFASRLYGVPLVVDEDPFRPLLEVEYRRKDPA